MYNPHAKQESKHAPLKSIKPDRKTHSEATRESMNQRISNIEVQEIELNDSEESPKKQPSDSPMAADDISLHRHEGEHYRSQKKVFEIDEKGHQQRNQEEQEVLPADQFEEFIMELNEQATQDLSDGDCKAAIQKLKYAEQSLVKKYNELLLEVPWLLRIYLLTLNNLALTFKQ